MVYERVETMESMQFAEAAVKEFLLFRGFTHTLQSFDAEVEGDLGHAFQVDRIIDLLFAVYVPHFEADNLVKLMTFFQQSFIASADARYHSTFRKLDAALKKYYIVHAVQKGRAEQAIHFFERHGDSLLRSGRGEDWHSWFALPYMKQPSIDPIFQVYFSKEWLDTLIISFRNFLSEVLDSLRLPVLLRLHSERIKRAALKVELDTVREHNKKLQAVVETQEEELSRLKSKSEAQGRDGNEKPFVSSVQSLPATVGDGEMLRPVSPAPMEKGASRGDEEKTSESGHDDGSMAPSLTEMPADLTFQNGEPTEDMPARWSREEEIPHVVVESQVGWRPSLATQAQLQDAAFPLLDQMWRALQRMELLGYGTLMRQRQHPEMQPYTADLRSWLWSGRTNLTACCC